MMELQTKIDLVESLLGTIQRDMVEKLKENRIPENWRGLEIKWWIQHKLDCSKLPSQSPGSNRKRYKKYVNDRLIGGF